jgi:sugar phosphate isomerase/epimerase
MKISLVGIVGKELEADFWGTLKQIAAIGYQGLESGDKIAENAKVEPAALQAKMLEVGIHPVTHHGTKYSFGQDPDALIGRVKTLGFDNLCMAWGPVESKAQLLADAELYNKMGAKCQQAGVQLLYHNHNHEFARIDGEYAWDILMANTDPKLLQANIDVAWVTFGGADPVALIKQYSGRIPVLHMKDLRPFGAPSSGNDARKDTPFTEVGTGVVKTRECVKAAKAAGVTWLTVEQDRPADLPPMESIKVSFDNLKQML